MEVVEETFKQINELKLTTENDMVKYVLAIAKWKWFMGNSLGIR